MSDAVELTVADLLTACGADGLGGDPPAQAREAVLRAVASHLNGADPLRRATICQALRDGGFPAGMVDAALEKSSTAPEVAQGKCGAQLALSDPERWPEPVDGATVLDELEATFSRHLSLPDGAAVAKALWTGHAHAHDASAISPILAFTSPDKRCGKTTALAVLSSLVPRPLPAANITAAALFRVVQQKRPTLLVDEADTFLREHSELRGVLNSGHRRDMAAVIRTIGDDHEARHFSTWCPKAVALIGKLPGTLADRSIEICMRRRKPTEAVERFRADQASMLEPLRRRLWTWMREHLETLRTADPDIPTGLNDRAADNWRPLLAIADLAGGDWPVKARDAAFLLSATIGDETEGAGVLLLADFQVMFDLHGTDRLTTKDALRELLQMEERPWPEWYRGNPLTARRLAKLLRPFDVRPKTLKLADGSTAKGYLLDAFGDAFARYLPSPPLNKRHSVTLRGSPLRTRGPNP